MAKKIQIDIEVNGKMQKATVSTKKLKDALDGVSKSGDSAQKGANNFGKGLKGVGEQSANASKNFAKFSSGMGGFVGVYASLAAQLFAVSAAFQFLKRAGDLQTLQAGQQAYASATGVGLRTLTNNIIAATDATVTFQDAAQAAAIGTAAGLSTDQLTRLGAAAKDASIILGRDVTDSFNRLVRGVTKAEPELLDELGVILRLKDATETYAAQLGKSANELTAFERSQAVANDVLGQTEEKYSKILNITGGTANAYAQLGKAFDDIVIDLSALADFLIGPIAKVLTDLPALAIAAFGLLLQGPLSALGISFKDIAAGAQASALASRASFEEMSAKAQKTTIDVKALKAQFKDLAIQQKLNATNSKVLQRAAAGTMTPQDRANLKKALRASEKNYNQHGIVVKGIFKDMSITMVREIGTAFKQIELAEQQKLSKTAVYATKAKAMYAGVAASIKTIGAALATGVSTLLGWLGWIGLAVTAYQVLKDLFFDSENSLSAQQILYEKNRASLKELNKELVSFAQIQKVLAQGQFGSESGFANIGSALGQRSTSQAIEDFELLQSFRVKDNANEASYNSEVRRLAEERIDISKKEAANLPIEELEKRLGGTMILTPVKNKISEDEKNANQYFSTVLKGLKEVEKGTGMTFTAFTEFEEAVENGASEKQFLRTRDAALDVSKTIQEGARSAKDAATAVQAFANSLGPLNQGEQAAAALVKRIGEINKLEASGITSKRRVRDFQAEAFFEQKTGQKSPEQFKLVSYEGLSDAQEKERTELLRQLAIIKSINKVKHAGQMRALLLQAKTTREVQGEDAAQKALRDLKNQELTITDKMVGKEEERANLVGEVATLQGNKLNPGQRRRVALLTAELIALDAQKANTEERIALAEKLLNIERSLIGIKETNPVLQAEKLFLDITNKRLALEKQILDIRLKQAQSESEEKIADIKVNDPFANTDRMQAEEKLRLARQEVALKLPMIQTEYNNKLDAIDLEYNLLEAKREQTILEMQKLAIEADVAEKPSLAKRADEIASKLLAQNYDAARAAAKDAALATKNASEYGLGKAVRDAQRVVIEIQPISIILNDAAKSFSTALSDSFTTIFDSLTDKTMDLKEALKAIGRTFVQSLQKSLVENMLVGPLTEKIGAFFSKFKLKEKAAGLFGIKSKVEGEGTGAPTSIGGGLDGKGLGITIPLLVRLESGASTLPGGTAQGTGGDNASVVAGGGSPPETKAVKEQTEATRQNTLATTQAGLQTATMAIGAIATVAALTGNEKAAKKLAIVMALLQLAVISLEIAMHINTVGGLFGRRGGVFNGSSKNLAGYSTGGIAKGSHAGYPAVLHGTEAVVPLPNGKSIPVDMGGAAGMQQNNVNVNVVVNNDGTAETNSEQDSREAAKLGKNIARAVQTEIQNQKRAGGMLSPYGAL